MQDLDLKTCQDPGPIVKGWFEKMKAKWYDVFGKMHDPGLWYVLELEGAPLAASGLTVNDFGVAYVAAIVCEPSKRGLAAMGFLATILKMVSKEREMRFFIANDNKRVQKLVAALGSQPVAQMWRA